MTQGCKFCGAPAVNALAGKVLVCERHHHMVRETGRELAHTAARMVGSYVSTKSPRLMQAGAVIFQAVRTATMRTDEGTGTE